SLTGAGVSVNGLAYGFAFDDQGNHSTDFTVTSPDKISIDMQSWFTPNNDQPGMKLKILTQPTTTTVGATATVTVEALTGFGQPFYGATAVTIEAIGPDKQTVAIETGATSGIGSFGFTFNKTGRYRLKLTAENGAVAFSNFFNVVA